MVRISTIYTPAFRIAQNKWLGGGQIYQQAWSYSCFFLLLHLEAIIKGLVLIHDVPHSKNIPFYPSLSIPKITEELDGASKIIQEVINEKRWRRVEIVFDLYDELLGCAITLEPKSESDQKQTKIIIQQDTPGLKSWLLSVD